MNNENKPQDNELHEDLNKEDVQTDAVEAADDQTKTEAAATSDNKAADQADGESADKEPVKADDDSKDESDEKGKKKKKKNHIDSRKFRYGSMATAVTVVVIAVVVLINVVAGILNDRYPANLDLTKDKLFSLSDDSKQIAKNVNQDVTITVFADESTFSNPSTGTDQINTIFKQFYQATKQYNSLSNGKITTTYMDLTKDPAAATNYTQYNPSTGDILFQCGSRSEKIAYTDLFSEDSSNSSYSSYSASYTSKVEQAMASKIAMVTSDNTPVVMMLTGHDEDSNTKTSISDTLGNNNYTTKDVDITSSTAFDNTSTLAVIAAPTSDYSEDEITKLRDWLNNSGNLDRHLLVIVNYKASCPNLYQFLNVEYGIQVTDKLVVETDSSRIYNYNAYYPYGDVESTDYTKEIASKKDLMPVCVQLLTNEENNEQNSLYNVDVVTFPKTAQLVSLSDVMNQSNSSKITPAAADEYPIIGLAYATKTSYDSNNAAHKTNVLVSGSDTMFQVTSMSSVYNEKTIVSLLNGFTGNQNSVTIPSKSLDTSSLTFNTAQENIFWWVFVILVPLALLGVCLAVFLKRRRL